jgi:hypothetical protein
MHGRKAMINIYPSSKSDGRGLLEVSLGTERFNEFIETVEDMVKKPQELYLCRKINFGANGNLVRYEPVKFPAGTEFVNASVKTPYGPNSYKILGRIVDVPA